MTEAKQGHRYKWNGIDVMAMENGLFPVIYRITERAPWPLSYIGRVDAESLTPQPMVYFHGETPK
jgi:hypothetical protein